MSERIVVTGANGAVGCAMLRLARGSAHRGVPGFPCTAVVRSERAARGVADWLGSSEPVACVDYTDAAALRRVFEGALAVVHLPGILVERRDSSYAVAHGATAAAAARAAREAGVAKLVLTSAIGADPGARNRYFQSKGVAEEHIRRGGTSHTILRVPLLLGPRTEGARALRRETARRSVWLLDGGITRHQPLDVDDLALAIWRVAADPSLAKDRTLELGGPERVSYRQLVERAARLQDREVRVRRVPPAPIAWALALRRRLLGPGFDLDALEVLLTDTPAIPVDAARELGIVLCPLDETLERSLAAEESA